MDDIRGGAFHRFQCGSLVCTYRVMLQGDAVYLEGEERMKNHVLYYNSLAFPAIVVFQVRHFVSLLAENRTLPRMMKELAQEYFP